jgi:transcriptional regulator with GAF, ATPase, and Fis domain
MQQTSLEEKYFRLLSAYIADSAEEYLLQAADLGRELVQADFPPEDIVEFQESALNRIAQESPDSNLAASWNLMSGPMMELLMAYGLAFREQLDARKKVEADLLDSNGRLSEALGDLSKRSQEIEALFKISSILAEPGAYDDKLHGVMQELVRVSEADWINLRIPNPQTSGLPDLISLVRDGSDQPPQQSHQRGLSAFAMAVMESGKPVVLNDYQFHPSALPANIAHGAKSAIFLPIKITEETFGVAGVFSRQADHFNPELVRLLAAVVDGFGVFLESAKLHQDLLGSNRQLSDALDGLGTELERRRQTEAQLLERSQELEALFTISGILGQPGTDDMKLRGAMQALARIGEAAWVTLRIVDPHEGGLGSYVISIIPAGTDAPIIKARQLGPLGGSAEAMATGKPVVINNYQYYPDASPLHIAEGINASIACPIKTSEGTIGVLSIVSKEVDHFNPQRVQILTTVSDSLAVFL